MELRPKNSAGLALVAVVVGLVGLALNFVTCLGVVPAIAVASVGAMLAAVALVMALADGNAGIGLPVTGMVVCVLAVVVSVVWAIASGNAMSQAGRRNVTDDPFFRAAPKDR